MNWGALACRGAMIALLSCGALLALPHAAHADEEKAKVWDAPFAVGATLDLLPFALSDLLLGVEVFPLRGVSFEIAGGAGPTQDRILMAMVHIQGAYSHWAPGVELGMTTSPLVWDPGASSGLFFGALNDITHTYDERVDDGLFGRLGVSMGFRSRDHVQVRIHAGLTGLLNPAAAYCSDKATGRILPDCHIDNLPTAQLYAGATVGYAFGL